MRGAAPAGSPPAGAAGRTGPPVESNPVSQVLPQLSVVILTCDRPDDLVLSVRSVLAQDLLPAELILVDDGALDPAPVRNLVEGSGVRFVYHRKERRGISRSRNIGARLSRGDLVMYLDDDERMEPGYIRAIVDVLRDPSVVAAAGVRAGGSGTSPGRLDVLWRVLERLFLLKAPGHRILVSGFSTPAWDLFREPTDVEFLSGTATYRRVLFDQYRFDEELERYSGYAFGEDLAFSFKIRARGRRVVTPDAVVAHHRSPTSRPPSAELHRLRLYNQYYIYANYLRGTVARPLPFAWALAGKVILATLRLAVHPGRPAWDTLRGTAAGSLLVARLAWQGGPPAPGGPERRDG